MNVILLFIQNEYKIKFCCIFSVGLRMDFILWCVSLKRAAVVCVCVCVCVHALVLSC